MLTSYLFNALTLFIEHQEGHLVTLWGTCWGPSVIWSKHSHFNLHFLVTHNALHSPAIGILEGLRDYFPSLSVTIISDDSVHCCVWPQFILWSPSDLKETFGPVLFLLSIQWCHSTKQMCAWTGWLLGQVGHRNRLSQTGWYDLCWNHHCTGGGIQYSASRVELDFLVYCMTLCWNMLGGSVQAFSWDIDVVVSRMWQTRSDSGCTVCTSEKHRTGHWMPASKLLLAVCYLSGVYWNHRTGCQVSASNSHSVH